MPERRQADAERPGERRRGRTGRRRSAASRVGRRRARLLRASAGSRAAGARSAAARVAVARAIATRSSWSVAHSAQVAVRAMALVAVGAGEIAGGERGHEHRVVAVVGVDADVGDVGHGASDDLHVGGSAIGRGRRAVRGSATEQLHPVGEPVAKGEPAAMDPRLDGAERDAGHLGDLGVVVALDVEQDDRGPLVVGDRGERVRSGPGGARS